MVGDYASTHTGATNERIREMRLRHLEAGGDVRLAIVRKAVLEIAGDVSPADLDTKDARQLIENAALAVARRAGERICNL
jgi:hypothetical protein